jgi:hypothetical protein
MKAAMHDLPKQPLLSMGQVRHTRLRPAQNTFSYGVFTLMLPLRTLRREGSGALAHNLTSAGFIYHLSASPAAARSGRPCSMDSGTAAAASPACQAASGQARPSRRRAQAPSSVVLGAPAV